MNDAPEVMRTVMRKPGRSCGSSGWASGMMHLVNQTTNRAICGATPSRWGWSPWPESAVSCPRCVARIARIAGKSRVVPLCIA